MGELEVIKRLRAILEEYKSDKTIPHSRIEQVIKDYDRSMDEYLDNLYKNMT
tara:strand:+ start:1303 stop:1458 length:156 start_codon:yes stop_codon:yes gene_type:complete